MIINRLNYEVFLVDYLDGKLNPSLVDELLLFLDQNTDIKNELEGVQDAVLVAENTVFPNKSNLKKKSFLRDGIDNEFEYLCISSVEGVITKEEDERLQKVIENDQIKRNQYQTYQRLKIASDPSISYPKKLSLKRTSFIPIRYSNLRLTISAAASVALLIGVFTIGRIMVNDNPLETFSSTNIVASNNSIAEKITEKTTNNNVIVYKEEKTISPIKRIIIKEAPIEKDKERTRINIEESIPNEIRRIDLALVSIPENHDKEIAQLAAKYAPDNQILLDQLYAQQESNGTKEFGAFEAIQYGVKSIGRLFGRDIKLDANKDEKGKIDKIIFESKLVAFSTQVNNNE